MDIFFSDLDNTLIYSYKHDIGQDKICVEVYRNREVSFMTGRTWKMLQELSRKMLVVPVTTRTEEQYARIRLGLEHMPYALVCNGGVLLTGDGEDKSWYEEARRLIQESQQELQKAEGLLEHDPDRTMEVRNIRELFLFTKSSRPEETVRMLRTSLDLSLVHVLYQGVKVYVVPQGLSKGVAVQRLREKLGPGKDMAGSGKDMAASDRAVVGGGKAIAAGDSAFDVSMLNCVDVALAPWDLDMGAGAEKAWGEENRKNKDLEKGTWEKGIPGKLVRIGGSTLFSEGLLEYILAESN